jgi:hypothetical protein
MEPHRARNAGVPLDLAWVERSHINMSAVNRRAATHQTRRTVKMEWQSAWYLRAVTCIDLTTLSGDDTQTNVERLCFKAKAPIREDLITALGVKVSPASCRAMTNAAPALSPARLPLPLPFCRTSTLRWAPSACTRTA